ncbi:SsgA family sporulation/cell division regulator [Nonomuraea wenchangensis]|uniref:SsgA family sporulation/cell division regulator n=1 Tax=Nonomuraea wenchangensis TaxID=568860 RepID=UPI00331AAD54
MTRYAIFIHRPITLWSPARSAPPVPFAASAVYTPDDPFAVEFAVPSRDGGEPHSVLFARGLLIDGVAEPAGDGDVHVAPHPDSDEWVRLELPIDGRPAEFYAERSAVDEFVDATCLLVPSGREAAELDLDGMIARLLGAGR